MLDFICQSLPLPEWAQAEGCRYRELYINELVLRGKLYQHIPYAYCQEYDKNRQFLKRYERRPSVRLHLPILATNLYTRKLFGNRVQPDLVHDDDNVLKAVKTFVKNSKLYSVMLDASYWAGGGSVAITISIVNDMPVLNMWQPRFCIPKMNEANKLAELYVAMIVDAPQLTELGMRMDVDGDKLVPDSNYWYIRVWSASAIVTLAAIKEGDWNPERPNPDKEYVWEEARHNFGVIPAVWIKNLPGGDDPDGKAIFHDALATCVDLDYKASGFGRGADYAANPQLMVKGKILNLDRATGQHVMGPQSMLQLPADRKDGEQEIKGADAKIIEMDAAGISIGMEKWFERMKVFMHELMSISRKDPNTISGTMSGKAMELVDEDFVDLVHVGRVKLGDEGQLEVIKTGCHMMIAIKHKDFSNIKHEQIDELANDWPLLYKPSPQEVQFLVQAITSAIEWGMLDQMEGRNWLEIATDHRASDIDQKAHPFGIRPPAIKKVEPNVQQPEPAVKSKSKGVKTN